ncbi:Transposable element Tc1 transposase [Ceratobasidium sp. AG-Ba]|nr:Transposable element Tc1 transposase [Ceratobasidium sp. AG-Ba]
MPVQRYSELSEADCGRIVALCEEGFNQEYIASKVGCTQSAVSKIFARYKKYHTYSALPRSGHPREVTECTERHVLRVIRAHRFWSYQEVSESVGTVNAKAVQKIAAAAGYCRCVAIEKPALKPPMVTKRLNWAHENTGHDWTSDIWCDETAISTDCNPGRLMVTRKPDEAYLPECLVSSYHSGRESLLAWACVAHGVKGPIIRLKPTPYTITKSGRRRGGGLSAQGYAEQVVSGPLKTFWEKLSKERGKEMFIIEDGAGPHRGKVVQIAQDKIGMKRRPHPPNPPDLNPIEPLWFLLKKRVAKDPNHRRSLDHLWIAVEKAWASITVDEVKKHTGQMDTWVDAVKQAKGIHTRF